MFVPHIIKTFFDLLDNFLASGRVCLWSNSISRTLWIFVFDNDARIDRIDSPAGHGIFVLSFELDASLLLNKGELLLRLNSDFLFLTSYCSNGTDGRGELFGLL